MKILTLILLAVFTHLQTARAQDQREYERHEVIELTNGLKVEVVGSRGTGPGRELDVIYYTEKRQTGKRMWQLATVVFQEENTARIAKGLKPLIDTAAQKTVVDAVVKVKGRLTIVKDTVNTTDNIMQTQPDLKPPKEIKRPNPAIKSARDTAEKDAGKASVVNTADSTSETPPDLKPERIIRGPMPAIKPAKQKARSEAPENKPAQISAAPVLIIPVYTIPKFDSGARHNFIIGLDSINRPINPDDSIAADFFSKPYDLLVPAEIIDSFKKKVTFPLPVVVATDTADKANNAVQVIPSPTQKKTPPIDDRKEKAKTQPAKKE